VVNYMLSKSLREALRFVVLFLFFNFISMSMHVVFVLGCLRPKVIYIYMYVFFYFGLS
jgi:hypothetical protein